MVFTAFVNALGENLNFARVEQERAFHPPIGNVNIKFDLFGEDEAQRATVDLQHVREDDTVARFHHYHQIAEIEQVVSAESYVTPRTVYTWSCSPGCRASPSSGSTWRPRAGSDLVTRSGRALGVLRHRLVVLLLVIVPG